MLERTMGAGRDPSGRFCACAAHLQTFRLAVFCEQWASLVLSACASWDQQMTNPHRQKLTNLGQSLLLAPPPAGILISPIRNLHTMPR